MQFENHIKDPGLLESGIKKEQGEHWKIASDNIDKCKIISSSNNPVDIRVQNVCLIVINIYNSCHKAVAYVTANTKITATRAFTFISN